MKKYCVRPKGEGIWLICDTKEEVYNVMTGNTTKEKPIDLSNGEIQEIKVKDSEDFFDIWEVQLKEFSEEELNNLGEFKGW